MEDKDLFILHSPTDARTWGHQASVAMVADLILVTEWWIDQDFSKIPILILPQPGRPPLNLMLLCITNTTSLKFKVKFCFATL